MFKAALNEGFSCFLYKKKLINLKTKVMRSGLWFELLQRIDKVLFHLIIRVVGYIRNSKLAKIMLILAMNLKNGARNSVLGRLREIGLTLSRKISLEVQKPVNISASAWVFDSSFEIFLVVMLVNDSKTLKR